jgi:hypothetical protein
MRDTPAEKKRGPESFVHKLRTVSAQAGGRCRDGAAEDPQVVHTIVHRIGPGFHRVIDRLINRHR